MAQELLGWGRGVDPRGDEVTRFMDALSGAQTAGGQEWRGAAAPQEEMTGRAQGLVWYSSHP